MATQIETGWACATIDRVGTSVAKQPTSMPKVFRSVACVRDAMTSEQRAAAIISNAITWARNDTYPQAVGAVPSVTSVPHASQYLARVVLNELHRAGLRIVAER